VTLAVSFLVHSASVISRLKVGFVFVFFFGVVAAL
jgi:hypothetical protein